MRWKEFIFTGAYTGYFPFAPGTAGTVLAVALYILENYVFGNNSWIVNIIIVTVFLYPSIKLCGAGERFFNCKDPSPVVLDEIIGYKISVLFLPYNWHTAIAAFVIFRFMDIIKPWPAGYLQKLNGGLGIMIDDCIAGLYTFITVFCGIALLGLFGIYIY